MIRNYFFLNRFITEISPDLTGSILVDAFSQDKDKLILAFKKNDQLFFIEINTNPGQPYITIKNSFYRAKRNTLNFFTDFLYSECRGISIAESDRLIKISLSISDIYFAIRGKFTNVVLIDHLNKKETFKKYEPDYLDSFSDEVKKIKFIDKLNNPDLSSIASPDYIDHVKMKYPFLGKEIFNEFKIRSDDFHSQSVLLNQIINEALYNQPEIIINNSAFEVILLPSGFHTVEGDEGKIFISVSEAFNYFIQKSDQLQEVKTKTRLIEKHIIKELTRLSSKLNNLKTQIDKGSRENEYNKLGNLLLINIASIHRGKSEIELEDIYNNNKIIPVKLDPKISPEQNANRYFEKARNERINLFKSKQLFTESENKFQKMNAVKSKLESKPSARELNEIMKELSIKSKVQSEQKEDISNKFKHYILNNKYDVFVGKDSRNNDLLTTRFAKQNDFWFHARSVSGSHVVLRLDNTKEPVPKDILKKVASIAAYHSKAKTAGVVPVSYCLKKYVVKKKGMPLGQVALLKEETLLVRPHIPEGSEFVINE
ncbi:MAG: NFACT RNA binding domain-containing protein [Ignavibacteriaceae bacterium]